MEGFAYTSLSFRVALFFRPRSRISHFRNFVKVSDFIYLASLLGESPRGGGRGYHVKMMWLIIGNYVLTNNIAERYQNLILLAWFNYSFSPQRHTKLANWQRVAGM